MRRLHPTAWLVAATLTVAGAAWADDLRPAPPTTVSPTLPATVTPGPDRRVRVRSSHTVDVIAPGEKVDTIIGKMRAERPLPPPTERGANHPPPVRGPEKKRDTEGGHPPPPGAGPRGPQRGEGPPPNAPR
jgi:hypothetical protein